MYTVVLVCIYKVNYLKTSTPLLCPSFGHFLIKICFSPPRLGENSPYDPSYYKFNTTFLFFNHINGQDAFTKCVSYLFNLPTDKCY